MVTGIGVISPLGSSADEVYQSACAGRSGVHRLDIALAARLSAPIGATAQLNAEDHVEPAKLRMLDRFSLLALVAAIRHWLMRAVI